jgi:hypothetical protein
VQIWELVAVSVTTRRGTKEIKRVGRGAWERVKMTSPVLALATRLSYRCRSWMGFVMGWEIGV